MITTKSTTKTDLLLPKYIQCPHYDRDYVEIEWNINAITSEPYLLNLKIITQNIHGVTYFLTKPHNCVPLYMPHNNIQVPNCTNL